MEFVFWILLFFVFYTYLGYPLILCFHSFFHRKLVLKNAKNNYPKVSVVIAARNEEQHIERRIRNIEKQDCPPNKLEVIVVSDGSNDNTADIVTTLANEVNNQQTGEKDFLTLFSHSSPLGKPSCINTGVAAATGDIVIFADCRQRFADNAIRELVKNFADESVGCVSGELVLEKTPGSSIQAEMDAYWKFEKWLRRTESHTGSVPGATGAIYAIRRELFRPLPDQTLLDDVLIPMRICMQGFRTVFDSHAVAYDTVSMNLTLEKKRKIRTLAGNWQLLFLEPKLLNPFRNPLWFRFLSHKIFRLLAPYCFMLSIMIAFSLKNMVSLLFLMAVSVFFLISLLPPLKGRFGFLSRPSKIFRSLIFFNYFAMLAPFKLIFSPRKLW